MHVLPFKLYRRFIYTFLLIAVGFTQPLIPQFTKLSSLINFIKNEHRFIFWKNKNICLKCHNWIFVSFILLWKFDGYINPLETVQLSSFQLFFSTYFCYQCNSWRQKELHNLGSTQTTTKTWQCQFLAFFPYRMKTYEGVNDWSFSIFCKLLFNTW